MKGWLVRGKGDPWDVFEWSECPEPSHEAMRELTIDLAGQSWYLAPGDQLVADRATFVVTPLD